jgi:uncharacterized lipoprotein YmbA
MIRGWCAGVMAGTLLSACASSPPMRFYTLREVPPAAGTGAASTDSNPAIRVTHVQIPAELDRVELVQRVDDSDRLQIAEQDRWAAPLDDMIRRVLSIDLQARMAPGDTTGPATLSLDIDEFTVDSNCAVTLRASWELKPAASSAPAGERPNESGATKGYALTQLPAASSCSTGLLPQRMSQALGELSERIVGSLGGSDEAQHITPSGLAPIWRRREPRGEACHLRAGRSPQTDWSIPWHECQWRKGGRLFARVNPLHQSGDSAHARFGLAPETILATPVIAGVINECVSGND